jgi:hypothetical protein
MSTLRTSGESINKPFRSHGNDSKGASHCFIVRVAFAAQDMSPRCSAVRPTGRNVFQCQRTDFSSAFVVWNGHNCDQSTCMTAYRQLDTEPKTTVQLSTSKPENAITYVKEVRWQSCNPSMCDSKQVIILFERCVEHRFRTVSFIN